MCWVVPVTWESPSFVVLVLKEIKDSLCLELAWSSGSLWKRRGVTTSPPILLDAVVPLSSAATPGSLASEQGLQILPELLALNRPRSRASFTNQVFIQPGYSQITGHCWYMYSPCWEEKVTHTLPQHAVHSRTHVKPTLPPASWPYRFWCLSPGYRRATPDHLSEAPPSALSWILGNLCWTLINPPSYPPSHPMLELLDQPTNHSHIPPDKKILRPQASLICSHSLTLETPGRVGTWDLPLLCCICRLLSQQPPCGVRWKPRSTLGSGTLTGRCFIFCVHKCVSSEMWCSVLLFMKAFPEEKHFSFHFTFFF